MDNFRISLVYFLVTFFTVLPVELERVQYYKKFSLKVSASLKAKTTMEYLSNKLYS